MSDRNRDVIERFWRAANDRDWDRFAALLHPELLYVVPQTRERVKGSAGFVELFRTWPGEWHAAVEIVIADEARAVSTINFSVGTESMTGISFFELTGGLIRHVTDYWPSPYEPPARATPHMERDQDLALPELP